MTVHKLKDHGDHFKRIARAIAEANGLPVDDEAVIDTAMGETSLEDVIRDAMHEASELKTLASAISERIGELQARKERLQNGAENIRQAVASFMLDAGIKSLRLPEFTLSARITAPKLEYVTPEAIPAEYWREKVIREIDKDQIKAVYEIGGDIPGVTKTNGRPSLTVRTK